MTYARSILDWWSVPIDFDNNKISIGNTQNFHISAHVITSPEWAWCQIGFRYSLPFLIWFYFILLIFSKHCFVCHMHLLLVVYEKCPWIKGWLWHLLCYNCSEKVNIFSFIYREWVLLYTKPFLYQMKAFIHLLKGQYWELK